MKTFSLVFTIADFAFVLLNLVLFFLYGAWPSIAAAIICGALGGWQLYQYLRLRNQDEDRY